MKLQNNSWYVRMFRAELALWEDFSDQWDLIGEHEEKTNLCFFFRTILIWGPLTILANIIAAGVIVFSLIILPLMLFGGTSYLILLGIIVGIIVGGAVIVSGAVKGLQRYLLWRDRRPVVKKIPKVGPSFTHVVGTWLSAKKSKICPIIEFDQEGGR